MIKHLIETMVQRPRVADLIVGLIVLVGLLTVFGMRSNFLPPEPVSFVNIQVVYRGASPQEVEEEVVDKIEDNLEGLKGIDRVTSTSRESFAEIRVELLEDANVDKVILDIKNAVDRISTFPNGVETPSIRKEEVINYTMTIGIVGDELPLTALKDYAKHIKDELTRSPDLSQVFLSGFPEEEIEISLRERDLKTYGLTFDEVANAIRMANIKASGGELKADDSKVLIRLDHREYFADGFLDIPVKTTPDGKIVRLKDVAEIKNQFADKPNKSYVNGRPAVVLKVFSRSEEDILKNTADINAYVSEFNASHEGVEAIVVEDRAVSLSDAIGTLVNSAWQGILLVLLVLGLFLSPRVAFWVAFKIPVALLGMFILSNFYDLTINQVSLFGLIIVLGVIVDDGVVVAENIYQKFVDGSPPLRAAINGTIEVIPSIVASLATTAVAFSLFFFLDGQLGDYFSDISFVVCATLLVALLESLFILPVHIARSKDLSRDRKPWKLTQWTNNSLLKFRDRFYQGTIGFFLRFPLAGIALVLVAMGLTIAAMGSGLIKGTFFPTIDQDVITAQLELPLGTDESAVEAQLVKIEEQVWKVNTEYSQARNDGQQVVKFVERIIGPTANQGSLNIYMLEGNARGISSREIANSIKEAVGPVPQARNLSYGSVAIFGKPVSIALVNDNLEELRAAKAQLRDWLEAKSDLKDVTDTDKLGMPELSMELTPKAKFLGLSEAMVFNEVRKGFFGLEAQSLQRGDEEVKVWLRYNEDNRRSLDNIKRMQLKTPQGASYPVEELMTFFFEENVAEIGRQNSVREVKVEADIKHPLVSVPAILAEAEATVLKDLQASFPNLQYTLEGEARLSSKTQGSSQGPGIIVLIVMIGILMFNYRSFSKTLAILIMLPFAFVGVAWGTFLHNIPVSIFSILGMIALWGILINNGLVLISKYNDQIKLGYNVRDALQTAAISRFRPIVLTSITTVFGLMPLLFNNSISAQFLKPTAIAISYGLLFGMLLSLVFLPCLLVIFAKLKYWAVKYVAKRSEATPENLDVVIRESERELA